jgi:protein tyrosine phosphatase
MKCGVFKIRLTSVDIYTHYIIRKFMLTRVSDDSTEVCCSLRKSTIHCLTVGIGQVKLSECNMLQEHLSVTQFHFTAWPDKSVPDHCLPLVMFHQLVTGAVADSNSGPLLVHCRSVTITMQSDDGSLLVH